MGFVGGGGIIAIATVLGALCPYLYCILFEIIKPFTGIRLHLFFMRARGFGFRMWRLIRARGVLSLLLTEYTSNVRGLSRNLSDLTVASSYFDILAAYE